METYSSLGHGLRVAIHLPSRGVVYGLGDSDYTTNFPSGNDDRMPYWKFWLIPRFW